MNIRLYTESDSPGWDDFVLQHPKGTFFHLAGWKRVVEASFGHRSFYLIAERNGGVSGSLEGPGKTAIAGVFPLFRLKSFLFGRSMVSIPFASYGGILAENPQVERDLYQKAVALTEDQNLDYLEIRNENSPLADLPSKDLYYNFKKEIFPNDEENLKAIPRKSRRMVRMGLKNNLGQAWGGEELLDEFYDLFVLSYHGFGTPVFSKRYLRNLLREFGDHCAILIIRSENKPLSGVMSFFFRDEVVPYYSGAHPISREYAANDYLYWSLMCIARERGCKSFDFGRSKKDTGPYRFKRHWGFEPKPLLYQYYLNKVNKLPNISPQNPKYQRRIELWKKLPLWLTKLIGPHIVKHIP